MSCSHIAKVLDWGTVLEGTQATLRPVKWGCTQCDGVWDEDPSESLPEPSRSISEHGSDCLCFGCKVRSLRVGYCGQGGQDFTAQKKWDKELALYRSAREQGIQPAGTTTAKVRAALEASDKTGVAYQAS